MKLLYILSATTIYGGATKAVVNLIYGLLDKGVELVVICPDMKGIYQDLTEKGIKCYVTRFTFSSYPAGRGLKNLLLFLPRLLKISIVNTIGYKNIMAIAKTEKPDIIHTNVSVIDLGYRVALKLAIPHIYHIREYQDLDFGIKVFPSKKAFRNRITSHKSHAICITRGVREYNELPESEATVIYDGVLPLASKSDIKPKEDYFLFAGRFEEAKGTRMLIEAYIKAYNTGKLHTKLLLAGSTSNSNYELMLKTMTSGYPIEFLGMQKDVGNFMKKAKALIVPSRFEGFGFVTAEAMFNGCLVIGKDTAGTKEQFDNGLSYFSREIGLRFTKEEELVEHLINISNADISEYSQMIRDGQEVAVSLYSTETHVEGVWNYYKEILRK